jgi:hypothetical protein
MLRGKHTSKLLMVDDLALSLVWCESGEGGINMWQLEDSKHGTQLKMRGAAAGGIGSC